MNCPDHYRRCPSGLASTSKAPTATRTWLRAMLGAFAEAADERPGVDAVRRRLRRADRRAGELAERLSARGPGTPGPARSSWPSPSCAEGVYIPELPARSPAGGPNRPWWPVICQAYVDGVSTRRVDDLVKAMGIEGMSKSEVSRLAKELDARGGRVQGTARSTGAPTAICGSTP